MSNFTLEQKLELQAMFEQFLANRSTFEEIVDQDEGNAVHGPLNSEGFVNVYLVDKFYEEAAKSDNSVVHAVLRNPDLPRLFLIADWATDWSQMYQIANNSAFMRRFAVLGGSFEGTMLDFLRWGPPEYGKFLPSKRETTLGMYVGYEQFSYEGVNWVTATETDATGVPLVWELNENRTPWDEQRILDYVRQWFKGQVDLLGADPALVNFSPN